MTRSISGGLAPLLGQLELDRPQLVTLGHLNELLGQLGMAMPIRHVVYRLRKQGWLLPTGVRGVYEFAPGDRAGPYSEGDALLPLRAALADAPELPAAVALGSALWLLNIADRGPDVPEVAFPHGVSVQPGLKRAYRVVRFASRLPHIIIRGLPVHTPASVLVNLADRPSNVQNWAAMLELVPALTSAAPQADVLKEIAGRPHATKIRLAYLVSGVAPELAVALDVQPAGKVWFGPRRRLHRNDARWNIADTILPFAPKELSRVTEEHHW